MANLKLGDKVRDTVTGLEGIAIAKTEWLNGCFRWTVQPPIDKDGKVPEAHSVDEHQLIVVTEKTHVPNRATGGPRPAPRDLPSPTR